MKALKLALAVTAVGLSSASMAFNNDPSVTWEGSSGTVAADGCSFRNHQAGNIIRSIGGLADPTDWVTTSVATIQVRVRGMSSVQMTSDNVLRQDDGTDTGIIATVDYTGGAGGVASGITNAAGGTDAIASGALSVTDTTSSTASLITFSAGGSASLSMPGQTGDVGRQLALDSLANDTAYKINHTVTCSQ